MPCIFVITPSSCSICLDSRKLQCLIDHPYTTVSEEGKKELRQLLEDNMNSPERYKATVDQAQRKE